MAKEKFREWKHNDVPFKIGYTDPATGQKEVWTKDQDEWKDQVVAMVDDFWETQHIAMGCRSYHYQHVIALIYPNADELNAKLSAFLTDLRECGLVDWDAIIDDSRPVVMPPQFTNVGDFLQNIIPYYRLPRWSDQEYYVELFCEKQGLEPKVSEVCKEYHISVSYDKGFGSTTLVQQAGRERIRNAILEGKKARLLYIGDHDAAGLAMIGDIRNRIIMYLANGDVNAYGNDIEHKYFTNKEAHRNCKGECSNCNYLEKCKMSIVQYQKNDKFQIVPLALTKEQTEGLPANPTKEKDSNTAKYEEKYGKLCWEIDALRPDVLRQIVEDGIKHYLDDKKYQHWIRKEKRDKKMLEKLTKEIK